MATYHKTHELAQAAEGHIENIHKRGGTYSLKRTKGKFEVEYSFPENPKKTKAKAKAKPKTATPVKKKQVAKPKKSTR